MIGVVDIEIQAHSPQFPLARLVSFIGSPQSVRVRNVPRQIGSWRITRVYVKATYPDGAEAGAELKLVGGVWVGTFAGSAVAGSTSKGFAVYADGIDENGGDVSGYVLGVGDVDVLTDDGRTLPQEPLKVVNIVTEKPSSPHVGDAIWNSAGDLEIWDGSEWRTVGGGGGGGAVESVNGKTGAVVLTGADINTSEDDEETLADKVVSLGTEVGQKQDALTDEQIAVLDGGPYLTHVDPLAVGAIVVDSDAGTSGTGFFAYGRQDGKNEVFLNLENLGPSVRSTGNYVRLKSGKVNADGTLRGPRIEVGREGKEPASITKNGKEVATEDQLRVTMQLVGDDPYTVQLDGETLTFAQIKTYAQTRNSVIQRGQGTYRVTYIGATEMMWDVTGTVQGEVKTGQIHIFDQSGETVVQRVEPKVIATRNYVDGRISETDDGFKNAVLASAGHMVNVGDGEWEYVGAIDDGETEAF